MERLETISQYAQIIPRSGGGSGDTGYGQNVAVTDSYMAVSAIRYDADQQVNSGCIFLYDLDAQGIPIESSVQVITASDSGYGYLFGDPVKIIDNYLITASLGQGRSGGQVYIYDLDNDLAEIIIPSPTRDAGQRFGCSIDMTEDKQFLFVGALGIDTDVSASGVVYCYSLTDDGYELYHVLDSPWPTQDAGFGRYVEVTDTQLIVGSLNTSIVFAFDLLTLQIEDVMGLGLSPAIDGVGAPIDVYEDVMVIGAKDSFGGYGCALVYHNSSESDWIFQGLVFDRSLSSSSSGISVSVDDEYIVMTPKSAYSDNLQGQGSVTLYSYTASSDGIDLEYESTLIVDNGKPGDFFGKRVALGNGNLYSTSLYDDNINGIDSGSVYVIPLS
ncbi:hypothetical protein N9N71_03975 [Synechococcus sp. AH-229-G18]|nr:hypothetical protein [Synechococcus sp. AH-229-G18]